MNKWKTKEGQTLSVAEMTDTHILNAMKCMKKNAAAYLSRCQDRYANCLGPNAEQASYLYAQDQEECWDADWSDVVSDMYWELGQEAFRRKLDLKDLL